MKPGIAVASLIATLAVSVQLGAQQQNAPGFSVLYNFSFLGDSGSFPIGRLVRDNDGDLYGTTVDGGQMKPPGHGVVFKLDPHGNETVLYAFTGGADGRWPFGGLIRDDEGNLYGTTLAGGVISATCGGCGVVFKLAPNGEETVLHAFTGGADGGNPAGNLARDGDGNLYGVTGGGQFGSGTVFRLDPQGNKTVLYAFTGGADGGSPNGDLVRDDAGNLYGTTADGGITSTTCILVTCGLVFELDAWGHERVLYAFTGGADGGNPNIGLVRDDMGNLYGSTSDGGPSGNGVIFEVDPWGHERVLYAFTGGADGYSPFGITMQWGNIYGTSSGGTLGNGTVFKVDPWGTETILHTFDGSDGTPFQLGFAPLLLSENVLYGAASFGGTDGGGGTVFSLPLY